MWLSVFFCYFFMLSGVALEVKIRWVGSWLEFFPQIYARYFVFFWLLNFLVFYIFFVRGFFFV